MLNSDHNYPGLREYIVSPLLVSGISSGQFLRRKRELDAKREGQKYTPERLDWWSMRSCKLPDSALSGAISGGFLNAWKRGRAGIPSGMTTGALVCTVLQLAYNELGVVRLKYVSKKLQEVEGQSQHVLPVTASSPALPPPSEPVPWTERVFTLFGLQKVSDEEYLTRLKGERAAHLQRIAELEKEEERSKSTVIDDPNTQ
ncbi:hypothetical protein QCA50_003347 [Cerrena zonata]|uniref:Transmembrane protein n=1 Tax=Cerrena zonata TaxID=2478898 RepID=A0AAW0GW63_9APHY